MPYHTNDLNYDGFKERCIGKQLKFVIIPKKCYVTGKRLWLELAYRETAMWDNLDNTLLEYRWYDKHEYLLLQLKK